jgi:hypothetical protein
MRYLADLASDDLRFVSLSLEIDPSTAITLKGGGDVERRKRLKHGRHASGEQRSENQGFRSQLLGKWRRCTGCMQRFSGGEEADLGCPSIAACAIACSVAAVC